MSAGRLIVALLVVLCPELARAQAMIRDEPALHVTEPENSGVLGNDRISPADDPTVRQPPSAAVVGTGLPAATIQGGDASAVDLTGGRGATLLTERAGWRPIFYLNLGIAYNDNIFITEDKQGDAITTIEPGIILAVGDFRDALPSLGSFEHVYHASLEDTSLQQRFLYLDYHPSIYIFSKHGSQNSIDESANLLGSFDFPKLQLGIHAQYQKLSIEDVDAGFRIDRDFYTLDLSAYYIYSDKTSLDLGFSVRDHEYTAPFVSTTELVSQNYLNYAYGPKFQVSAGFAAGYINYRHLTNQTYQQILGRVTSVQLVKLDFTLNGGIEFRQTLGGRSAKVGGIFDGTLNFRPYDSTVISLLASRNTQPSALADEDVTYTRVGVSLQQRILSRIYLTLGTAYGNADYTTITGQTLSRTDNYVEFSGSAATDITQYATLEITYLFRNADSTLPGRTYTENVAGLDVRFTY